jgi:FkbM family methyltransferase
MIDIYERYGVSVHPGDVVLDIGAYRGTFTRHALESGARVVVAFEPQPDNYGCLEQTFAPEINRGAVRLVKAAIWDKAGTLQFSGADLTGHVSGATDKSITVAATTIDDAVRDLGLDRVDFIKMDIEGAERHAVRGATRTLAAFQPRMALCVYHLPDDPKPIPSLVLERQPKYRVREFAGEQTSFW